MWQPGSLAKQAWRGPVPSAPPDTRARATAPLAESRQGPRREKALEVIDTLVAVP